MTKIIDCITYFNEPLLFELRLNILNEFVDEFIVCEATYTHKGLKKEINFDKKIFNNFKDKIKHVIVETHPSDLEKIDEKNKSNNIIYRMNAAKRIRHQRNEIVKVLSGNDPNDWIIYSDSDEIPNLKDFDLKKCKNKIVLFNQLLTYYKFNLSLSGYEWFGSKACRLKNLSSIDTLRNIKTKKYPWWRIDTVFKKDKFIDMKIVNKGGWHFTEIKSPKDIYLKHKNDEHHDEFDLTGITENDIEDMVKNNYIPYDHKADKRDLANKWNKNIKVQLTKISDDNLPKYLIENKNKYSKWFE